MATQDENKMQEFDQEVDSVVRKSKRKLTDGQLQALAEGRRKRWEKRRSKTSDCSIVSASPYLSSSSEPYVSDSTSISNSDNDSGVDEKKEIHAPHPLPKSPNRVKVRGKMKEQWKK